MTMQATYLSQITARETLEQGTAAASDPQIVHDGFNTTITGLNADSDPPCTEAIYFEAALVAGAYTIDLTALLGADGAVDGTGLKVQMLKILNPAGNSPITVKAGAANGYNLGNDAAWRVTVGPGSANKPGEVTFFYHDTNPDVAAGAKNIDVSGTGVETFQCAMWLG